MFHSFKVPVNSSSSHNQRVIFQLPQEGDNHKYLGLHDVSPRQRIEVENIMYVVHNVWHHNKQFYFENLKYKKYYIKKCALYIHMILLKCVKSIGATHIYTSNKQTNKPR